MRARRLCASLDRRRPSLALLSNMSALGGSRGYANVPPRDGGKPDSKNSSNNPFESILSAMAGDASASGELTVSGGSGGTSSLLEPVSSTANTAGLSTTRDRPSSTPALPRKQAPGVGASPQEKLEYATYRPPAFQPIPIVEQQGTSTASQLATRVQSYHTALQESMKKSLEEIISKNRLVHGWVRQNKRANGSMLPREHFEKLPDGVGVIHISAGENNTLVTLTDWRHRPLRTITGGMCGLPGHQRGSLEAGTRVGSRIAEEALKKGLYQAVVNLKGFGKGREPAFRSIVASGLKVLRISDKTPIPHGGCRPKKARRV